MKILVDSNVLIDLVEENEWTAWSVQMIEDWAARASFAINPLIFAEVSVGFDAVEKVAELIDPAFYEYLPLPWEAAFIAGKMFVDYRRRGGARRSPLPDFYIGAHALASGMTLLTRDGSRYRTYFPKLKLVAP